ncbi:MAG TPA: GTPase ObgE [candidate division WOR-3 bacterium]|uniref:GTPase Obg n=1 Tax=candidate division WOR-3 bacterium TaxID=2052148 RepID=A0A9C9K0D9_UNCW3|nr:GTPase ObgE [candidate division WOR-3 bacterium]
MKFIDEAKIFVTAGKGGNGCISFRREKFVPRGGPDGGDGGAGGSVYLIGKKELGTLYDLRIKPHYRAGRGSHGKGKNMSGKAGKDVLIPVPLGVVVYHGKKVLGEILFDNQKLLIAKGGKGGRGNRHFVTATNQTPRCAEPGAEGEKRTIKLVLKLISDIGLVGFPNAGKSTLLRAMTDANPRIGDYPFTTLAPNLGVIKNNYKNIVIADMPGIIEGAHAGKGLGHQFLRHIERTKKLLLIIDITSSDPLYQYNSLLTEFRKYSRALLRKERIVIFNKIDLVDMIPDYKLKEEIFYISALKGTGVKELIEFINR